MPDLASNPVRRSGAAGPGGAPRGGEGPTRLCPACYAMNAWERTRCERCGAALETPRDFDAGLLWALDHPDTGSAMLAARLLGERKTARAIGPLGRLSRLRDDPYRAAAAVRALAAFAGDPVADAYLEAARSHPSVIVRRAAGARPASTASPAGPAAPAAADPGTVPGM